MLNVNTYKVDNAEIYFGVTTSVNSDNPSAVTTYEGYQCGFQWWDYIKATDIPPGYSSSGYASIPGTLNGFVSTPSGFSNLKVIVTNGSTFGMGVALMVSKDGNTYYVYIIPYLFNSTTNNWVSGGFIYANASSVIGAWDSLPRTYSIRFYKLTNYNSISIYKPSNDGNSDKISQFLLGITPSQFGLTSVSTVPDPEPVISPDTDPYKNAGDSDTGGGGGSFDGSSDPIDIPSLPSVGATNTGFISLFVPTEAQIRSVANYLWSNFFDVSTFFKIVEDPMDCILGLSVVPVTVPTGGNAQITVGNIELSGITLPLASAQYVEVDCGTISFENKFFGSYLDYEPYTKMAIFLPYCGVHQINADDIMGKVIRVVYHVDILTGSCVAFVKCGDSVLYQFNGACATNIPITNISYNSTIENAIRIAVNIGTTVATAGASAPLSAGAETVGHTAQNIARGVSLAGSTAEGALSLKPSIGRSGALGGTTGIMAGQKPYLIITRPRLCKPKNQDYYKGYPSFIQTTVGDLIGKGYTEFDTIIISTLYLTDNEDAELERIMQGGVYL